MPTNIAGKNRISKHREAIRDAYKRGATTYELARQYGCHSSTILCLVGDLTQYRKNYVRVKARRNANVAPALSDLGAREKAAFRRFDELGDKVSYDRWQEAKRARIEAVGTVEGAPRPSRFY